MATQRTVMDPKQEKCQNTDDKSAAPHISSFLL